MSPGRPPPVAANAGKGPFNLDCNPSPPAEFGAPGIGVTVPWLGGGQIEATGNSFAALPEPRQLRGRSARAPSEAAAGETTREPLTVCHEAPTEAVAAGSSRGSLGLVVLEIQT